MKPPASSIAHREFSQAPASDMGSSDERRPVSNLAMATSRRRPLAVLVLTLCLTACFDRTRVNTRCEWSPESAGALDLSDWPQQRHLYEDVALAEELAIRYADTMHKERYGFAGHGGLIEGGQLRDRCMAGLISAIATAHEMPEDQVRQARARGYRDIRWDVGVLISFTFLYAVLAWLILRRIARRFPIDEGWPAFVAPLVAAVPVGTAAFQLFLLWGSGLEAIRLGNGHVSSYRSSKPLWSQDKGELWIASIVAFLMIAALHRYATRRDAVRL